MRTLQDVNERAFRVVRSWPENIDQIAKVFPLAKTRKTVLFAYGDMICNPHGLVVPAWIVAHELIHMLQQEDAGGPGVWWNEYLSSPAFRLREETEAHKVEFQQYREMHARPMWRRYRKIVAEKLSSPLYNNMIRTKEAEQILRDKNG